MKHDNLFIIWGLFLHLFFLWGVLDVNFHSPILHGLPSIPPPVGAPAKRLILFVADGLRYRTFKENPPTYLRQVMHNQGSWGVSHTRLPTESRPGNIAIVAGLYEDPSAIFKGWQENPVDFDSVFNQSDFTQAWGSPHIIPIFTKNGAQHVHGETYPHEWEDFDQSKGAAVHLDSWVFDKYSTWLKTEGERMKNQSKVIFFLHLLGCDTTGHSSKPQSRNYIDNMKYVDRRIELLVKETELFFGDQRTAYVFTSDHGMTDWGSHGSGSTDETETPLVMWGSGVSQSNVRHDVRQVDITPLISTLLGITIPVNNEGVVPLRFLHYSNRQYGASCLFNNIMQLLHQIKGNRFINYGKLTDMDEQIREMEEAIEEMKAYIKLELVEAAIDQGAYILSLAEKNLHLSRQFQRKRFLLYLTVTWCSWIFGLFYRLSGVHRKKVDSTVKTWLNLGYLCSLIIVFLEYLVSGGHNWRLLFYGSMAITSLYVTVLNLIRLKFNFKIQSPVRSLLEILGIVWVYVAMFSGMLFREILSIGMLFAVLFQKFTMQDQFNKLLMGSGLLLVPFPLLPVVEPHPRVYIVQSSILIMIIVACFIRSTYKRKAIEILRLLLTGLICAELIDGRYWLSWMILITTPISIWSYSLDVKSRLMGIVIGLFCPLALLSASYEPLFFLALSLHLFLWPEVLSDEKNHKNGLNTNDLFKASNLMLYTLLSFFGTGNMASISSFDPLWTRHFVTVFSPFLMTSLILLKLSIPLMIVGCTINMFELPRRIFMAILLLGDMLSLALMYHVTPYGSWLTIGSAISRFTIAITLPCLLLFLYYFSKLFMKFHVQNFLNFLPKTHIV